MPLYLVYIGLFAKWMYTTRDHLTCAGIVYHLQEKTFIEDLVELSNSPRVFSCNAQCLIIQGKNVHFYQWGWQKNLCLNTTPHQQEENFHQITSLGSNLCKVLWSKNVWWSFVVVFVFCFKNESKRNKIDFFLNFHSTVSLVSINSVEFPSLKSFCVDLMLNVYRKNYLYRQ